MAGTWKVKVSSRIRTRWYNFDDGGILVEKSFAMRRSSIELDSWADDESSSSNIMYADP